ncbi:hypothetical protein ACFYZ9_39555 [Streptomyces sp. NPDC001691]|uniref:hypothetical protein n=1 Tax=Streptomyces sp. NPDC001691 TaxID=3364600 RepID=UPI0036962AA2
MHSDIAALAEKAPSVYLQNVAITLAGAALFFWIGRAKLRAGSRPADQYETLRVSNTLVTPPPPRRSQRVQGRIWIGVASVFAFGCLFNLATGISALSR